MSTREVDQKELQAIAKRFIRKNFNSQTEAADHYGISHQYLCNLLSRSKKRGKLPDKLLEDIGCVDVIDVPAVRKYRIKG